MQKREWWMLTEEEADRLNPPVQHIVADESGKVYLEHFDDGKWLNAGYIPLPTTRLEWFAYHLIHGLAMRYPWWKVFGFALANTKPETIVVDDEWLERNGHGND